MRKHTPIIGWPRRDPRHYRFPLPNAAWEYKLKPIEFVILSYLCCQHSHGGTNLPPEMIAKGVHLTVAVGQFHQRQLDQLELDAKRRRVRKRQERFARDRPHAAPRP